MSPSTDHRRRHHTPPWRAGDRVPVLDAVAQRLAQILAGRGVDLGGVEQLARALKVNESVVRAAAAHAWFLGLCAAEERLMVFCLPPQPLAAGFHAEHRRGRLVLRLPVRHHRPALLLSGHWVGPVPVGDRGETVGAGELAHLVSRLVLMARSWLPTNAPDPARYLFELIAWAWRSGPTPRRGAGMVAVHRADLGGPVALCNGVPTSRLELVTNHQGGIHQLVNVYPVAARG
jgi:hypothetical protein